MAIVLRRTVPFALVCVVSLWLASQVGDGIGDWQGDSWPAVHSLASGHLSEYLSAKAMMGPFSTLVEAPFAAMAGGDAPQAYGWAAFPCLLAAGLLGLYLARIAGKRGASRLTQVLLAGLCLVNPITIEALSYGHPEEILTAALAVGAVATASEGRHWWTAVLLGLALASKQWAVLAVLPALMALPDRRARVALAAGALVALLILPGFLAAPGSFSDVNHNAASAGRIASPWSVWYPIAGVVVEKHQVGGETLTAHVHKVPSLLGSLSHPAIVLLVIALPLGLVVRRRTFGLSGDDAMGLLALLVLLRCCLDPVDNLYYHEPLLLALVGWDALATRGLPVRALGGVALALLFRNWSLHLTDVSAFNLAYLVVALSALVVISLTLFRRGTEQKASEGVEEAGSRALGLLQRLRIFGQQA